MDQSFKKTKTGPYPPPDYYKSHINTYNTILPSNLYSGTPLKNDRKPEWTQMRGGLLQGVK